MSTARKTAGVLVLVSVLFLSACGSSSTTGENQQPTTTTTGATTTTTAAATGAVNPCDYVSASEIESVLQKQYLDGRAIQPSAGVKHCLWLSTDGTSFVDIVAFGSADNYPGNWSNLTNGEGITPADVPIILQPTGVDLSHYRDPSTGLLCTSWSPRMTSRQQAFAVMLYSTSAETTTAQDQQMLALLAWVHGACTTPIS